MTFALTLAVTILLCFVLRTPLMKWPVAFYAITAAAMAAYVFGSLSGTMPREVWLALFQPIQKALVPLALFIVVMYIGLFPRHSKVSQWLRPVRAELSIVACILMAGHVVIYIGSYLPRLFNGSTLDLNILASFIVAMVLFVLLLVLGITSFQFVKKHMDHKAWKSVQKLAYAFFVLSYVHLLLILLPAAMRGGVQAIESVVAYTIIFGIYIIGRPIRAFLDAQSEPQ